MKIGENWWKQITAYHFRDVFILIDRKSASLWHKKYDVVRINTAKNRLLNLNTAIKDHISNKLTNWSVAVAALLFILGNLAVWFPHRVTLMINICQIYGFQISRQNWRWPILTRANHGKQGRRISKKLDS